MSAAPSSAPRVSIIMPTHNRGYCIARAIRSVLDQTMADLELIVVDDGSTDDTRDVVSRVADPRVRYTRLAQNVGQSAATNHGAALARAPWLALADSDDYCVSSRLADQMAAVEKEGRPIADGVFGRAAFVDADGRRIRYFPALSQSLAGPLALMTAVERSIAGGSTLLVRSDAYRAIGGFDEALFKAKDQEFVIRFLERFRLVGIDQVVMELVASEDSITGRPMPDSLYRILNKHRHHFDKLAPKRLADVYAGIGDEYLAANRLAEARPLLAAAVRLHPSARNRQQYVDSHRSATGRALAKIYARTRKITDKSRRVIFRSNSV